MNRQAILKGTAHFSAPLVLVVAGSLATLAVMGTGHSRPLAAEPAPAPTVTVTQTKPPTAKPSRDRMTAHASTTQGSAFAVAASDRKSVLPHTAAGGTSHTQGRPPTAPKPTPPAPSPSSSSGAGLSLRLPLGVLPTVGVDLTVGGNR